MSSIRFNRSCGSRRPSFPSKNRFSPLCLNPLIDKPNYCSVIQYELQPPGCLTRSTAGVPQAAVAAPLPRALGGWCHRRGRSAAIAGAVRSGAGATPLSLSPCRLGSVPSLGCAGPHVPLHALRRQGWIYASSRLTAPWIHLNSSLISAAALPLGADSDADNPDVKAWTCSIL